MTLPFVAGQSYLDQITQEDFRKPHFLLRENNVPYLANGYAGVGGRLLAGKQKPAANSFQNTDRVAAPSQWPHIPHATLQFGSYVYEDFVNGRTDEKIPARIYQVFFYLEDNTVEITESQAGNTEYIPPKHLSRQRVPRANDPDTFLTVYDFTVGKPVIIYGRQHMIYSCDLYTRNTLTAMGFVVALDQEPPYSQIMAASKLSKMDEKLKRHFNTDGHFARFLQYDGQVLRFSAVWNDKKSMFGDEHKLLAHFYLSDGTLEILRKEPQLNGRDMWRPFIKRARIPKKVADLGKVNQGAPWPVLKTMPNGRHPIKNYQLFDQAQFPDNVEVFTDVDLQCGREICVFGRPILLTDCDDFTKWYYRHRYEKEQEAIHLPDEADTGKHGKVCPYNQHGSEEDSILNCRTLRPTQPLTDLRKYLLIDQDAEDPKSLVFSTKMVTNDGIDASRSFVMTFSLNDDSVCLKERAGNGNIMKATVEKKPVKKSHDPHTTLPQYLQPEDLYVGAVVQLRGTCFLLIEADEATLSFMEKYSQRFPYSDIQKAMTKFFGALPADRDAVSTLRRDFEDRDSSKSGLLDWDQFVKCLTDAAKSALVPHEYNTLARNYSLYPHISKERRRELLRTFIQQRLRQAFWEPQNKLLTALIRIDVANRKFISREEMDNALKATRIPVKYGLVAMYLDLVEADNGVYYEEVVRDLDWVRNPGRHLARLPEKMDLNFDFNKFFGEDKRGVRYRDFIQDFRTFGCR